jgi:hypothetical protein
VTNINWTTVAEMTKAGSCVAILVSLVLMGCPRQDVTIQTSGDRAVESDAVAHHFIANLDRSTVSPAEAALLDIIESRNFTSDEKLKAAEHLTQIEQERLRMSRDR